MAILNLEKLKIFNRREPLTPRQKIALEVKAQHDLEEPACQPEFVALMTKLLENHEITTAYAYALDVEVDYDNWSTINNRVVDMAGGYAPSDTMHIRMANALWQISQMSPDERQAIATIKPRRNR